VTAVGRRISPRLVSTVARGLLRTHWFPRNVVLDGWFLHAGEGALSGEAL